MRKCFLASLLFVVALTFGAAVSAQVSFKDVPADHWAAPEVYDFIKLGVARGYPDGTFRGNKLITRYETTAFLSRLAKTMATKDDIEGILKRLAVLEVPEKADKGWETSGRLTMLYRLINPFSGEPLSGRSRYRVRSYLSRNIEDLANIKLSIDTLYFGFIKDAEGNDYTRFRDMFGLESNVKVDMGLMNPVNFEATYGPGNILGLANRPEPALKAGTNLFGFDVGGKYAVIGHEENDEIRTSNLSAFAGYVFNNVLGVKNIKVNGAADYISRGVFSSENRDIRGSITFDSDITDKINVVGSWKLGGPEKENWMASAELILDDALNTKTFAALGLYKIGTDFYQDDFAEDEWDWGGVSLILDPFLEGTCYFGGFIDQEVGDKLLFSLWGGVYYNGQFEYRRPGGAYSLGLDTIYTVMRDVKALLLYDMYEFEGGETLDRVQVLVEYYF